MTVIVKFVLFVAISILLLLISRRSLRAPGSHGFYRFFAWEAIAALLVLNVDRWFRSPFAWHQLISWALLCGGLVPLAFGVHMLTRHGKPVEQRAGEPQLLAFEKTTTLVTTGIYRYIRHPLYSSLFLLAWGIFFKAPSGWGVLLAGVATGFLIATARADERECLAFFGPAYREYMRHTKMFIPFLF